MIDGEPVDINYPDWDQLEVAAFVGDELRMTAMFLTDEYVIDYGELFPTLNAEPIYYTTPGETVTFKLYNHATGVEYDVCEPVIWDGDPITIKTGEEHWEGFDDPDHPLMLNFISPEPSVTYNVTMKEGTADADNWKAKAGEATEFSKLPLTGVPEGEKVTLQYEGRKRVMSVRATKKVPWDGDLAKLTGSEPEGFATATDGMTISGKLADGVNVKVTIADRATVTLSGATIEGTNVNQAAYKHAGITCLGNATIVLVGTNKVKGFYEDYPGIYVPKNNTLTICGDGSLDAQSNGCGCGIGGGYEIACGNITIEGGSITATGGNREAGIGGGYQASCGDIRITGGKVEAKGGFDAVGIGSGSGVGASCGDIRITGGTVEATGGEYAAGIGSGSGVGASCGDISIEGGSITAKGGDYAAGIGSGEGASCGNILITGGTVEAHGGFLAAGIGGGSLTSCHDITITSGVTKVTATKGSGAPCSIGKGYGDDASCDGVTVGCTLDTDGKPEEGSGMVYNDGIATSPYTYWGVVVPLTMEALTNGKIKVVVNENDLNNKVPTKGMQYAVNDGEKKTIKKTTEIDVEKGDRVTFYGNDTFTDCYRGTRISGGDAEVMVYGNIMSLVDEKGFASANALSEEYAFSGLFGENTTLKDASGLLLPAKTLTNYCYISMFIGCSALTAAPELPATKLAEVCYNGMFYGCSALKAAPELPATKLAKGCYNAMFRECSALKAAPTLPATELVDNCYSLMFYNCTNLASVTCLATSGFDATDCLNYWLAGAGSGVTGTKTLYVDPGMTGASWNKGNFTVTAITP